MDAFFHLIQVAIGKRETLDIPLTADQWEDVFQLAKKQTVLGVIFKGVMALPQEQLPPRSIKVRFALVCEKIEKMNVEMNNRAAQMTEWMRELGFETCVLKGPSVATLYPWPEVRQCGDIDLWVNADYRTTLKAVSERWKIGKVFYHHAESHPFNDRMEVEFHFTPNWMNSPILNKRLQSFFRKNKGRQFGNISAMQGFSRPTSDFDCVYSAVHIFRHLLLEGIGIRQVMDYYFILMSSTDEDRKSAYKTLSALGMRRFIGGLMYVLKDIFDIDEDRMICPADAKYGEFLKNEILLSGNFGQYDARFKKYDIRDNIIKKAVNRFMRLPHYFSIAPAEVLWAPYFKTWQHLWRYRHGFK